jgi:hypothetical protein
MTSAGRDPWAAFFLSLLVPGAGQVWERRWSGFAWFALAVAAAPLPGLLEPCGPTAVAAVRFALLLALALACAEDARRGRRVRRRPGSPPVTVRLEQPCCAAGRVRLALELAVPRPRAEVWALVADAPRFLCIDPFHVRVVVLDPPLRQGASLALEHRAFGVRLWRFGRLLRWDEGRGYAFSDLSARGPRRGFPHVFFVSVTPAPGPAAEGTVVRIEVRGRWTARWVPVWLRILWLRFVAGDHARLLRAAFEGAADV